MTDLFGSGSKARRIATMAVGIVVGAAIITPSVGLAAKFLTQKRANRIYVRYMGADRGNLGTIVSGGPQPFSFAKVAVPTNGFLLIQGSAHVYNDDEQSSGQDQAELSYQVDMGPVVTAARATLGPDLDPDTLDPGETAQLAYVDVIPVTKSPYFVTVRQRVQVQEGSGGPPDFEVDYSAETLVVTFFPAGGANFET